MCCVLSREQIIGWPSSGTRGHSTNGNCIIAKSQNLHLKGFNMYSELRKTVISQIFVYIKSNLDI